MTSPVKNQSQFDIADFQQPEVTFSGEVVALPLTEIEGGLAQACKQFQTALSPSPSHVESSIPSLLPSVVGSVNQQMDDLVMTTFHTQRKTCEPKATRRERWQENLSLFLRRKAGTGRGFTGWLANLWDCSASKASKVMYGEANPHWTDFLILYEEYGPEIIEAVLGDDTADLAQRKHMLRKLLELIEAEST